MGQHHIPTHLIALAAQLTTAWLWAGRGVLALWRGVGDRLSALDRAVLLGYFRAENGLQALEERGQSLVEYGIVGSVMWMVIVITLKNVGSHLGNVFTKVAGKLHS